MNLDSTFRLLIGLWLATALPSGGWAQESDAGDSPSQNPAGIVLHREHADEFIGGEEVTVRLTISASTELPLYALGLYETTPPGWTFEGLNVDTGPQPDILPPRGASDVLEFGWVSPAVPVTIRYFLRVPPKESGARFLTGQVEYRLDSDPRRNSPPVLSRITGVANETPLLTLRGAAVLPWLENQPFIDPGVTAHDKEDGDLSGKVEIAGRVDVGVPGEYTLIYGVVDSVGNRATPVTRVVQVGGEEPGNEDTTPTSGAGAMPPDRAEDTGIQGDLFHVPFLTDDSEDGAPIRPPSIIIPKSASDKFRPMHQLPPGRDGKPAQEAKETKPIVPRLSRENASATGAAEGALTGPGPTANDSDVSPTVGRVASIPVVLFALLLLTLCLVVAFGRGSIYGPLRRRNAGK